MSTGVPTGERLAEPSSTVAVGHPVRNFVAVLILLAASLGALWWTGAVTTRLEVDDQGGGGSLCGGSAWVSFRLSNPTPFSVTVRTVQVTVSGLRVDRLMVRRPQRATRESRVDTPLRPFRLGAGEARIVTALGATPRRDEFALGPTHVAVTARTVLGITRTLPAGQRLPLWGAARRYDSSSSGGCRSAP